MPEICPRCGSSWIREGACLRCGAGLSERQSAPETRGTSTPGSRPAALSEETLRPAGFWIRFLASLLDALVLSGVALLVTGLGALIGGQGVGSFRLAVVGGVFNFFFHAAYYIVLHGATGQTVGKLIVGVRVSTLEGTRVSYAAAFIRWLGYFLSGITLFIGYLLAGVRTDKRALHDLIAGTQVVYVG